MSASGSSDSSVGVGGKIAGREKSIEKIRQNAVGPHQAVGSDQVPGVLLKSCSTVLAGTLANILMVPSQPVMSPGLLNRLISVLFSNLVMFL